MKGALRWLLQNVGLLALSLFLATLVWLVAVEQESPTREDRFRTPVPIDFTAPPDGMMMYDASDTSVYVTLRAPESVWQLLHVSDFYAVADLSGLAEGVHRVPIEVSIDQRPTMVRDVAPSSVTVHVERVGQKSVPVQVRIDGNTALGYLARAAEANPATATVSGPVSFVEQVTQIVVHVSVAGSRADVEGEFELQPLDMDGNVVPHVRVIPSRVAVRVPVEQLRGFRDLTTQVMLEGQVAPGYRISSVSADPPVVTVFGPQDAIDQIPGYLETVPLNVEGARETIEIELPLVIPPGVTLTGMDEPNVTVRVTIVPQEGSVTVERQVEIQGRSPGITVTVAPTMVQVFLSGPLPVLDRLQPNDIQVVVDVFGMTPGSYSVVPRVLVLPNGVQVDSIAPTNIQVEIRAATTPTPEG